MTRVSDSPKEQAELLLKSKILAAIKKSISKPGKDCIAFERIQEDEVESISSTSSINEEMNSEEVQQQEQPKYIFKKPLDKCRIRKMNNLAQELNQLFNEVKENAPIKRRRKITIYGL